MSDLKNEIVEMRDDEKEIKQPDKLLKIVVNILEFNRYNKERYRLKTLTPDQRLSRLLIDLA